MNRLNPYLLFNGDGEKAIRLYEEALGAKTENIMRYGDGPSSEKLAEKYRNQVMHATLHVGDGIIMVSDAGPGQPVTAGSNVQVVLDFDDKGEMVGKFNALAATGKVRMPLADTFWGAHFGMLIDAVGVNWMFNYTIKKD
jgi:PhnB protein